MSKSKQEFLELYKSFAIFKSKAASYFDNLTPSASSIFTISEILLNEAFNQGEVTGNDLREVAKIVEDETC